MRFTRCATALLFALLLVVVSAQAQVRSGLPEEIMRIGRICFAPSAISETGIAFIKRHEGFSPRAYRDSGGYSIGYGMQKWKGKRVTPRYPGRVSLQSAEIEMRRQIPVYENIVRQSVCSYLTQSEFDALVSIAWNLGRVNTRILDKLKASKNLTTGDFLSTATVRGRVNKVLKTRRLQEFALFHGEIQ